MCVRRNGLQQRIGLDRVVSAPASPIKPSKERDTASTAEQSAMREKRLRPVSEMAVPPRR